MKTDTLSNCSGPKLMQRAKICGLNCLQEWKNLLSRRRAIGKCWML